MAELGQISSLASLYDPSIATDQQALERQMQLAQALRAKALEDNSGTQMAGQMAISKSPLEGIAKLLNAFVANKQDETNDASRQALAQRTMQAMASALRQPQAGQSAQPAQPPAGLPAGVTPEAMTAGGFPQPPQSSPAPEAIASALRGRQPTMDDLVRSGVIGSIAPQIAAAQAKGFEPTEFERQLSAAGIQPGTPQYMKAMQDFIAKQTNMPREAKRPGGYDRDPITGQVTQYPQVPPGFTAVQTPNGFQVVPLQGASNAIRTSTKATALGNADVDPMGGFDANGNPAPYRPRSEVLGYGPAGDALTGLTPGGQVPPPVQAGRDDKRVQTLQAELAAQTDPQERAKIETELRGMQGGRASNNGGTFAAPPLGTENQQKALDAAWGGLQAQNREASNTKSYLQNIVTAAEKGAIVGPGAERREMIQGVLQLAGIKESVNENATSQTQLLNKYHDQIVTRLGQGGLGTDAARALLDSAYPGQKMNVGAIREAAANLNGAQDMVQAKTRFLQDAGINRKAQEYQQREIQFDQAADPRIWQYKNIQNPDQRRAFAQELMKQDPSVIQRMKTLEQLGAL